ncbi:uncharacterized protein UTRI_06068 [Ustilago trichophora]|uniref:AB hydrolase-1 domain-containing protein n=1 Tax=Ustilago trichophora TaxID=86804 RepID=A0A5C3EIQ1_9BASI|nr:uncharacterized protein UTRI_06068 [Ustilago trichophora]
MLPTSNKEEQELPGLPGVALHPRPRANGGLSWKARLGLAVLGGFAWYRFDVRPRLHQQQQHERIIEHGSNHSDHRWGQFPQKDDPFHFLPCTNATLPPSVDESHPLEAWQRLYDPDPQNWSWGNAGNVTNQALYLCGWLDVPLDYTNTSDQRISRLAVTKLQRSPHKSNRTIVVEPGGPGGSGTNYVWRRAQSVSHIYSNDTFDVLGWDPRGVNASQPSISCFPYDADRDRWSLLTTRFHREVDPRNAMSKADAMNQAIFESCHTKYGDIAGMLTTAFVARDLEEIRKALGEDELSGYFVSYGTGIGQTYVNMFPDSVGRLMLDGTEYVRDQRLMGGFGWAALDNITAAFNDGFIGECVDAGPDRCALAKPLKKGDPIPTKQQLIDTMNKLFAQLVQRPIPGHTDDSGPMLITYSQVISLVYSGLYSPFSWDGLAVAFHELLKGNPSIISLYLDSWEYDPTLPASLPAKHASDELGILVICSDQYDSPLPPGYDVSTNGQQWYLDLWADMVERSEFGGDGRFFDILPCRQWNSTFDPPKEVYRGDLNHTLSNPVLLIAETYDPATPLRNGRRLLQEMGENARLIAHHGYGHSSRDTSRCTNDIMRRYMMEGIVPKEAETQCYADRKPYRYNDKTKSVQVMLEEWQVHLAELRTLSPRHPRLG